MRIPWLTISLCVTVAVASDFRNWSQPSGQGAFSFMENYQGPRSLGLSGAGASNFNPDPLAITLNPATVLQSKFRQHFAASWETGALAKSEGMLGWNFPVGQSIVQSTFAWTSNDPVTGLDESGVATGKTYSPFNQVFMVSAITPMPDFQFGSTFKLVRDHLSSDPGDEDALGVAMDWGLVWKPSSPRMGWGISVLDLGRQVRAYTQNGVDDLSLNTRIHLSGHYRSAWLRGLTLMLDGELPRYTVPDLRFAAEYSPASWLQLRIGSRRTISSLGNDISKLTSSTKTSDVVSDHWSLFSAGFGATWRIFTLDYSATYLRDELGIQHRLGLSSGF